MVEKTPGLRENPGDEEDSDRRDRVRPNGTRDGVGDADGRSIRRQRNGDAANLRNQSTNLRRRIRFPSIAEEAICYRG